MHIRLSKAQRWHTFNHKFARAHIHTHTLIHTLIHSLIHTQNMHATRARHKMLLTSLRNERCTMVMVRREGLAANRSPTASLACTGKPSHAAYACVAGSRDPSCARVCCGCCLCVCVCLCACVYVRNCIYFGMNS
jgi:hypothetical protein